LRPGGRRQRFSCLPAPRSCRGLTRSAGTSSTRLRSKGRTRLSASLQGWRSGHSRIIRVCPAPACQMRHRPGARNHPFTSRGYPVEELREGHVLRMLRPIARLVKRPGNIPAYAACRTGGSPSHHFGRTPNPKIRPYGKNTAYSPRRINLATDRMRSTNAQIWIRHFRYAADHGASGR